MKEDDSQSISEMVESRADQGFSIIDQEDGLTKRLGELSKQNAELGLALRELYTRITGKNFFVTHLDNGVKLDRLQADFFTVVEKAIAKKSYQRVDRKETEPQALNWNLKTIADLVVSYADRIDDNRGLKRLKPSNLLKRIKLKRAMKRWKAEQDQRRESWDVPDNLKPEDFTGGN